MSHATSTTPSIRIYDSPHHHNRYGGSSRNSSYSLGPSAPMAIPNAREPAPPPLPPPRYINENDLRRDTSFQHQNDPTSRSFGGQYHGSVKPGSSLLGGGAGLPSREKPGNAERIEFGRRPSNLTARSSDVDMLDSPDDDNAPSRRSSTTNYSLQSERQLGQKTLQSSSNAYDKQLLSKIDGPKMPSGISKMNGNLPPLTMPERSASNNNNSLQSPASRWASSGAISPRQSGVKSPSFDSAASEREGTHSRPFGSISAEDILPNTRQQRMGSLDQGMFVADFSTEENGMRDLNMNDRSPGSEEYQTSSKAGSKRVALSPPFEAARENRPTGSGSTDLYHRRSQQQLLSRFHPAQTASMASTASTLSQRHNSFASSFGLSVASSATSYNSDRLSPGALSPGGSVNGSGAGDFELGLAPPHSANRTINPSPRGSLSAAPPTLQRGFPENISAAQHQRNASQDSMSHSRNNSMSKVQGHFICDCCPKKPKKFDNEEELRIHELEKQYTCAYCPNRFKNKNEAERHQNSLHLRKHSWSCAALAGVYAAYHTSTVHLGMDVCGYCGEEFPNNPANWDDRSEHLNHVHKYGECNQAKKFFRADHFRQHLKHSHAGTSGKWTNQLENACQKDEPPPKEHLPPAVSAMGPGGSPGNNGTVTSLMTSVINEAHDES